jgi:hypothetical protein
MTVDLTGGMDPSVDEITAKSPSSPVFREGAAAFIWDDAGRFGFPRIMVEGVGATWQASRRVLLYFQQPGGGGGRVVHAAHAGRRRADRGGDLRVLVPARAPGR